MGEKRKFLHEDEWISGKWLKRSLAEQLANVGMDVYRTIRWKAKGNLTYSNGALERAFELLWFTMEDPKNQVCLKELNTLKEMLTDHFMGNNIYQTTDEFWDRYFYAFNHAYAIGEGK